MLRETVTVNGVAGALEVSLSARSLADAREALAGVLRQLKAEGSSITEGIGQGRITKNIEGAPVDLAYRIPDSEALPIVFDLLKHGNIQRVLQGQAIGTTVSN